MPLDPIGLLERVGYAGRRRADVVRALATCFAQLPPGSRVLDFGAGTGRVSAALAPRVPATYVLADVDPRVGAGVSGATGFERVRLGPGAPLPFPEDHFDGAFAVDVLHHLLALPAALAELHRVLRPDALLAVVEYRAEHPWIRTMGAACRLLAKRRHLRTAAELSAALGQVGFSTRSRVLDALRFLACARA